jgi:hypothetical protein
MTHQAGTIVMIASVVAVVYYIDKVYGGEVCEKFLMWLITAAMVGAVLFGHQ